MAPYDEQQSNARIYLSKRNRILNNLRDYTRAIEEHRRRGEEVGEMADQLYDLDKNYLADLQNNSGHYTGHNNLKSLRKMDSKAQSRYTSAVKEVIGNAEKVAGLERKVLKYSVKARKGQEKAKRKEIESKLEKIAAVILILIGASIVLSTEATITTYSIVPPDESQAKFFIIGLGLIALGIFFPSLAFFKRFIEKSKNKYSAIAKKKKKNKKQD